MAIVKSSREFDREYQKEYLVPIIIKDSGRPSLSGTSTLTITIGDVNDNRMFPGSKEIFVYSFRGAISSSYAFNFFCLLSIIIQTSSVNFLRVPISSSYHVANLLPPFM